MDKKNFNLHKVLSCTRNLYKPTALRNLICCKKAEPPQAFLPHKIMSKDRIDKMSFIYAKRRNLTCLINARDIPIYQELKTTCHFGEENKRK